MKIKSIFLLRHFSMLVVISAPFGVTTVIEAEKVGAICINPSQHTMVIVILPVAFVHLGAIPLDATAFAYFCAWAILAEINVGVFGY